MLKLARHMLTTSLILSAFAITGTGLVAYTYKKTKKPIAVAQREALLRVLHSVVDADSHDNELITDQIQVLDPAFLGSKKPLPVFRARNKGKPVEAIFTAVAPDGYNGDIKLIIGINYDGVIKGVRVIDHHETPGLGDAIEMRHSHWVLSFNGRSLDNPTPSRWKVKKDGGYFDQFTGATITPRAVVKEVHKVLEYFKDNKESIFSRPSQIPVSDEDSDED